MEKRLVDVVIRYGAAFLNEYTPDKWRAYLWLKTHFDERTGGSIYALLPGVVENTFSITNY